MSQLATDLPHGTGAACAAPVHGTRARRRAGRHPGDAGFTLVELLVTVTIIGVLAAIVTVGVSGASSTAQTQSNQGTFSDVQSGLDAWLGSNPTNAATDIVVGTADQIGVSAQWFGASGAPLTPAAALSTMPGAGLHYGTITFTQATGNAAAFSTFFRLNASSVTCVLPKTGAADASASSSTLFACHN